MSDRRDPSDRTIPHNLEAEKAVLGAILINNDLMASALMLLKADDFFRDAHRRIFRTMMSLATKNIGMDFLILKDELSRVGWLDEVGGPAYIASFTDGVPRSGNIEHYAAIVVRTAKLRRLIYVAGEISEKAYDAEDDPDTLINSAGEEIFALGLHHNHGRLEPIGDVLPAAMQVIERQSNTAEHLSGLSTGLHALDKLTGGLPPADLIVVAARPSMGKSSLLMNIAEHVSINLKLYPAIFSLEMSKTSVCLRLMASVGQFSSRSMMRGTLSEVEYQRMSNAWSVLAEAPLYIDDTSRVSMLEVRSKCRAMKSKLGLSMIGLDYLQLMPGDRRAENRNLEIAEITAGMKGLAKELDVPFVVLSQLSRDLEKRTDKRPILSDLRDSGSIEQDADSVVFIYRDEYYNRKCKPEDVGVAELIVAKARNGPTGTVRVGWNHEQTRFYNLTSGELY